MQQKACVRKNNPDLKKYLGQTGSKTTRIPTELSEREKLIISIIGNGTSEGISVGEAGFGQATFNPDIDDYQLICIGLEIKKNILLIYYKQFLVKYKLLNAKFLQDLNKLIYTVTEVEDLSETIVSAEEVFKFYKMYPSQ